MTTSQSALRLVLLFLLFWLIGLSLGYPTLNRYQPGAPQLSDATYYADMTERGIPAARDSVHWGYRLLVPMLAHPVYLAAKDRIGSWDARFFALLVVNAGFCAGAAVILFLMGKDILADGREGLLAAFLFFANFNTPNLYLSGLVDSAEVFLMSAMLLALRRNLYVLLPILGIVGGFARETFVVLSACLAGGWWLSCWRSYRSSIAPAVYILAMAAFGLATVLLVRTWLSGEFATPYDVARVAPLANDMSELMQRLLAVPRTSAFWYSFGWLLPLALYGMRRLPNELIWASAAAFTAALAMSVYGGAGENIGRPLFSAAGPALSIAAAAGLVRLLGFVPARS